MSAVETPIVTAFIVCDEVITDLETKKKTLVGIFSKLSADKFPCQHPKLCLYLSLTNGQGKMPLRISCKIEGKPDTVWEASGEVHFNNPLDVVDCVFVLRNVPFASADVHVFEVDCNDVAIVEKKIVVTDLKDTK